MKQLASEEESVTDGNTILRPTGPVGGLLSVEDDEVGIIRHDDVTEVLSPGKHSMPMAESRFYVASTSPFHLSFRLTKSRNSPEHLERVAPSGVFTVGGHLTTYRVRVTLTVVPEIADRLLRFLTESNATKETVTSSDIADAIRDRLQADTMLRLSVYRLSNSRDRQLLRAISDALREVLTSTVAPYGLKVGLIQVDTGRHWATIPARGGLSFKFAVAVALLARMVVAVFLLPVESNWRIEVTDWITGLLSQPVQDPPIPLDSTAATPNPSPTQTPKSAATVVAVILYSTPTPTRIPTFTTTPTPTRTPHPTHTPTVMPSHATSEYSIKDVQMSLRETGGTAITADWSLTIVNVAAASANRATPINVSVDGDVPQLIGFVSGIERGHAETSVISATIASGASTVTFTVGDAHRRVSVSELLTVTPELPFADRHTSPDRAALTELFTSTGGAEWTDNSEWLSGKPFGEWYGVTTDTNGRVTHLDLHNNRLEGTIPPTLGSLDELAHLDLGLNSLSGPIPHQLGNLKKLTGLYLHENQLSGTVPSSLSNLDKVWQLNLGQNLLSGSIPAELAEMDNLRSLLLHGNPLTDCIPDGLKRIQESDVADLGLPFCSSTPFEELANVLMSEERLKASFQNFHVITTKLDENGDHDMECKTSLGSDYRLTDWNDLKEYYESSGSIVALIEGLNWINEKDWATVGAGVRGLRVSRNGAERWEGSGRHYFASRHDHSLPSNFLVHDSIDNHLLTLGSSYGQGGEVLCTTLPTRSAPDGTVPPTPAPSFTHIGKVSPDLALGVDPHTERVIAALVDFEDVDPVQRPFSKKYVQDILVDNPDSLRDFVLATSRNSVTLEFHIIDWITVNKNRSDYPLDGGSVVEDAVSALSYHADLGQYDKMILFIFPLEYGEPGCQAYLRDVIWDTPNGIFELGAMWLSGYDMVCVEKGRIAHEYGHTFGFLHSKSIEPYDRVPPIPGSLLDPTDPNDSCNGTISTNGDRDMLGDGNTQSYEESFPLHFHAVWQAQAGWLPSGQVIHAEIPGEYRLTPLESLTPHPKAIRIDMGSDQFGEPVYYWLETRTYDDEACRVDIRLQTSAIDGQNDTYNFWWSVTPDRDFLDPHRGLHIAMDSCEDAGTSDELVTLGIFDTELDVDTPVAAIFNNGEAASTLTNNSGASIDIGHASIGGRHPAAFGISSDECSGSVLEAGRSCSITIRYMSSESYQDRHGLLKIPNSDRVAPSLSVSLYQPGNPTSLPARCVERVAVGLVIGAWQVGCSSAIWPSEYYARFYRFTLDVEAHVSIDVDAANVPQVFLYRTDEIGGDVLTSGQDTVALVLEPGDYTIEVTTYEALKTGEFVLSLAADAPTRIGE